MKRFLTSLTVAGLALGLATAANAQYFSHQENDSPAFPGTPSGTSSVWLTGPGGSGLFAGGLGTDIILAYVDTASTTNDQTPDPFNFNYSIDFQLKEDAPVNTPLTAPGSYVFTGNLKGNVSLNASTLINTNTGPAFFDITPAGSSMVYHVALSTFVAPQRSNGVQLTPGAIGAHVTAVPEPGTLSLLGAGLLPLLGLARRRK